MKKKFIIMILLLICLTGCKNEKELICTKINTMADYTQEIVEKFEYNQKTELIKNISVTYKETSDEETAQLNKNIYDLIFIKYNSVDGIKAETNLVDNKTLKYTISIEKNKLSIDEYNDLLNTTPNKTFLNDSIIDDIKMNEYQNNFLTDFECK